MLFFCICVLLLGVFLLIFAWSEQISDDWKVRTVMLPFYKIAALLHRKIRPHAVRYFSGLRNSLGRLYPGEKTDEKEKHYFVEKTAQMLMLLTGGLVLVIVLDLSGRKELALENGKYLMRNVSGNSGYAVRLSADVGNDHYEDLEIEVAQKRLTEEEFEESLPAFETELVDAFLMENKAVDRIQTNVNLADSLDNYPYLVEWSCSNWEVIRRSGEVERVSQKQLLTMRAYIRYEEYESVYEFPVMVVPKDISAAEKKKEELLEKVLQAEEESRLNPYLELPESVNGTKVVWTEKKKQNSWIFLLLLLAAVLAVFFGKDRDLERKSSERTEQMLTDYPEIVSKMTLFVGAGMSIRGAFTRVAKEYQEKREKSGQLRYAYEEMLITVHEMESGMEERKAYQAYAGRCHVQKYMKFGSLLEQNVRMGGRGLVENLSTEAKDALEEKRARAERLGEQAGTKLLFPMILMLLVVLVMIMVPAFMSM